MLKNKILSAVGASDGPLYSDDVFVSYLRTGTGADAVVNTGIDMTNGYMLWSKSRSAATDHAIYDSSRGVTFDLVSNSTAAQTTQTTGLKAVSSTGHTVGSLAKMNTSGATYVDWVFKKKAKFFDCGTYTGNGVAGRQIPHSLGVTPGMIIVKATNKAASWWVKHRSATDMGILQSTNPFVYSSSTLISVMSDTSFTVETDVNVNGSGDSFVWYAFAHDTSAEGIIQCGSFTGNITNTLGWEPQFVMLKRTDSTGDWMMIDSMRGCSVGGIDMILNPNTSAAEITTNDYIDFTATGFISKNLTGSYIYMAIRRQNKPPTTGTQVFAIDNGNSLDNSPCFVSGFVTDMAIRKGTGITTTDVSSRLTGTSRLYANDTSAENVESNTLWAYMNGYYAYQLDSTRYSWMFRRAPGVFETLCYTGTGANKTEPHGLSIAPELWLIKRRDATSNWTFGSSLLSATEKIVMPSVNGRVTDSTVWNSTLPSSSVISLGISTDVNASAGAYVAYLWSSKAGISKVFTYIGNGTTQTVNCGFTTGARFVMIIRATAATAQDIFVWDSTRGIISANDPHLSLNTTAAEVTTDDSIDPDSTGFIVNQVAATNINVNGAVYIGLAFA